MNMSSRKNYLYGRKESASFLSNNPPAGAMMGKACHKTVPDDILALSRQRIAANRPETDKLLAEIKNGATWEALAKARQEALVNFVATYKTLSIAIHDILCHKPPLSICPNDLCRVNMEQINAGIGFIARSSELEPKEKSHG